MPVSGQISRATITPSLVCLRGYYTFTTQSALSKRSCSNPRKSRLHWRKWLCSVHKCWPCVLTQALEALRQGALYPQAASQVTGSGSQLGRLCSGRGRREGSWRTPGSPHVSMPVVSVQPWKIWNTGMIHEWWNFYPGGTLSLSKTHIIYVNMWPNICKMSSRLTCSWESFCEEMLSECNLSVL